MAAATSKKSELKLTNVAKASLEELLLDYEDYLRQNKLRQWNKDDREALEVRHRYRNYPPEWFQQTKPSDPSDKSDKSDQSDPPRDPYGIANFDPGQAANTLICLINQAIYLLKHQLEAMEKSFLESGGFTEDLYRSRRESRRHCQ